MTWAFIPNVVGITGVLLILLAYFRLQTGRVSATSIGFSMQNAAGSALILISLTFNFNLASFLIELSWLVISLFGAYRATSLNDSKY